MLDPSKDSVDTSPDFAPVDVHSAGVKLCFQNLRLERELRNLRRCL